MLKTRRRGCCELAGRPGGGLGLYTARGQRQGEEGRVAADLQRVPRDAALFVTVRAGDLWALPEFRAARDKFLKESPDLVQQVEATFGVPPEDLDRVTFIVANAAPNTQPAFAIHTSRPYARKQVLAKAAPEAKEKKSGDHTLWAPETGYAFHFIDDRTFLVGPVGELETILDKLDRRTEGPLGPALKLATQKQALVGALNVAAVRTVLPPELPPPFAPFRSLLETDAATLTLEIGETIRGRAEAGFSKDAHAKDAEDAVGAAHDSGSSWAADPDDGVARPEGERGTTATSLTSPASAKNGKVSRRHTPSPRRGERKGRFESVEHCPRRRRRKLAKPR
jgi:hypothetical protein